MGVWPLPLHEAQQRAQPAGRRRLFLDDRQQLTEAVDDRLRRARHGDDEIGENRDVVLGVRRAQGVEDLDERGPLCGIVRRRRGRREQARIVDEHAIVRVSGRERRDLVEHRALRLLAGGRTAAPMAI